jgi:hypothetical protein
MTRSIAKIAIRVVGTLAGLTGIGMVFVLPMLARVSLAELSPWMLLLSMLPLAVIIYFIWVGYLVWFRFSPLAVRHTCGAVAFHLLGLVTNALAAIPQPLTPWRALVFWSSLVAVYIMYRVASDRLNRRIFPENVPEIKR